MIKSKKNFKKNPPILEHAPQRLQKVLSQAGLGSRREIEGLIEAGLISVNQVVAVLGTQVTAHDKIVFKSRIIDNPLLKTVKTRVLLYHKPIGEISSRSDPEHKKTVFDKLPFLQHGRWVQVGRLDINTSGLLIFTNEGELAHQLMHPSFGLEREYAVRVRGSVGPTNIDALLKGVVLDDGPARFKAVQFKGGERSNGWYHVILSEGRNREVRRLWATQNAEVSRLIRIRYGSIKLPRFLSRGQYLELTAEEIVVLKKSLHHGQDTTTY